MKVTIELLGRQRTAAGADRIEMPITEKSRLEDALEYVKKKYPRLKVEEDEVFLTVNQKIAPRYQRLKPGDVVSFLPFISGG